MTPKKPKKKLAKGEQLWWDEDSEIFSEATQAACEQSNHYPAVPEGYICEPIHPFVMRQCLIAAIKVLKGS